MFSAKVIEDSISPAGVRITTMQLTYPRYIHAEFMTHRVFSRNASSSRAIPTNKLIQNSLDNMVYPIAWGKNQAGMQSKTEELSPFKKWQARVIWKVMAHICSYGVKRLSNLGLHKQWANRPLEWFGNITVVVTATEWDNWEELRNHPMAQPEIHYLAKIMKTARELSTPKQLKNGQWHLPYITISERLALDTEDLLKMSTARCARVSYLTQEGSVPSRQKDLELYDRLVGSVPLHASPCEHQARVPLEYPAGTKYTGNFRGWIQHRKLIEEKMK